MQRNNIYVGIVIAVGITIFIACMLFIVHTLSLSVKAHAEGGGNVGDWGSSSTSTVALTGPAVSGSRLNCTSGAVRERLRAVAARFGPIRVISTFRRGATIRNTRRPSYHRYCNGTGAVDFALVNNNTCARRRAVARFLSGHNGGVGYYCGRHRHVHIDGGRRRARWVN